jgi:3,4-dihydroxy 2-butanone 4-phosphate synthase/GTP cyclohydrolase II
VVVYLRGHEGRGIGLAHKLRAYSLQEQGHDTVDANLELGLPVDSREYGIGAQILMDLGVTTMRVMTNNPMKYTGLDGYGLDIVGRVPLNIEPNVENRAYLMTKRDRLGHLLTGLDVQRSPTSSGPASNGPASNGPTSNGSDSPIPSNGNVDAVAEAAAGLREEHEPD